MDNNEVLRRIRYIFDFRDPKMVEIFGWAGLEVTQAQVTKWLKKGSHFDFVPISDKELATFLNGLITELRGESKDPQPEPEEVLNNNIILRKLKIAFNLKNDEMLAIMALKNLKLSRHELSAFFRKPTQVQYRPCKDEYLQKFLLGAQVKYRESEE